MNQSDCEGIDGPTANHASVNIPRRAAPSLSMKMKSSVLRPRYLAWN